MERPKFNLGDLFSIEFNKEFLLKNWPRLVIMLLVLLGILGGVALVVLEKMKPEPPCMKDMKSLKNI